MKREIFRLVIFLSLYVFTFQLHAQVGIGTVNPDPSAILDVFANDKGFLPPRLSSTEISAITSPAIGLIVYNTDEDCVMINKGTPGTPDFECLGTNGIGINPLPNCLEYPVIEGLEGADLLGWTSSSAESIVTGNGSPWPLSPTYIVSEVNGTSRHGGRIAVCYSPQTYATILTGLTIGEVYTIVFEWQPIRIQIPASNFYSGGQFTFGISGFSGEVFTYAEASGTNEWELVSRTFTAMSTSHTITIGVNTTGITPGASGGCMAFDGGTLCSNGGAGGGPLDCATTLSPILNKQGLRNDCSLNTFDFNFVNATNLPTDHTLTLHTASVATDANEVSDYGAVPGGQIYWAAFHNTNDDCYGQTIAFDGVLNPCINESNCLDDVPAIEGPTGANTLEGWTSTTASLVPGNGSPWPLSPNYILSEVNGASTSGGNMGICYSPQTYSTIIPYLTIGQEYTVTFEWQPARIQIPASSFYSGGQFTIGVSGFSTEVFPYQGAQGTNEWEVISRTFVASAETHTITIGVNTTGIPPGASGGCMVFDGGAVCVENTCITSIVPALSHVVARNECPNNIVDLNLIIPSNTPSGASLSWHTGPDAATGNLVSDFSVAPAGSIYYAAFYNPTYDCYGETKEVLSLNEACFTDSNCIEYPNIEGAEGADLVGWTSTGTESIVTGNGSAWPLSSSYFVSEVNGTSRNGGRMVVCYVSQSYSTVISDLIPGEDYTVFFEWQPIRIQIPPSSTFYSGGDFTFGISGLSTETVPYIGASGTNEWELVSRTFTALTSSHTITLGVNNTGIPPGATGGCMVFDGGGLCVIADCKTQLTPLLSKYVVRNDCALTVANLNEINATNTPAGTSLSFHTGSTATTGNLVSDFATAAVPATYWAAFYNSADDCYGQTTMVTALSEVCVNTTENCVSYVDIEGPLGSTLPTGWAGSGGSIVTGNGDAWPISGSYTVDEIENTSQSGGNMLFLYSPTTVNTTLIDLVIGDDYVITFEWQPAKVSTGATSYAGGSLRVNVAGTNTDFSSGDPTLWEQVSVSFTATNTNQVVTLTTVAPGQTGTAGRGIVVDGNFSVLCDNL